MSDAQAIQLLKLLAAYVVEYGETSDLTITEVAEDIVSSLDTYSVEAEEAKDAILGQVKP